MENFVVLYENDGCGYEETAKEFAAELRKQLIASGAAKSWQDGWVINCAALGPQGRTTGLTEFTFAVLGLKKFGPLKLIYSAKRRIAA